MSNTIIGTGSLLAIVDRAQAELGVLDHELCRRAGLSHSTLSYMRRRNKGGVSLPTAAALLNELGYDLAAVPAGQPVPGRGLTITLADLRCKLRDLSTSVANNRHPDDLRHEIDDILFWIGGGK